MFNWERIYIFLPKNCSKKTLIFEKSMFNHSVLIPTISASIIYEDALYLLLQLMSVMTVLLMLTMNTTISSCVKNCALGVYVCLGQCVIHITDCYSSTRSTIKCVYCVMR